MTEALCYLEIEMENTSLIDLLPSLEIVAKLNGLRLNRTKDFRLAKRLLIMNIYLNDSQPYVSAGLIAQTLI